MFEMFEIILSNKAKQYLVKGKYDHFLIRISLFSQKCVQIYEPKIAPISSKELKEYQDNEKVIIDGLNIYFSNQFLEMFKKHDKILIDMQRFPKKLIIKNVDPIIINTCKID